MSRPLLPLHPLGDRVVIPSGTCAWATTLTVSKGITVEGAGVGKTIILDRVPTQALLSWECQPNVSQRLTGLEFRNGDRTTNDTVGRIRILCTNVGATTFRLDHNKFDNLFGVSVRPVTVVGVIDHNVFITTVSRMALYVYDPNWNGVDDRWGDASWAAPVTWGSSQFLFVENNTFTKTSCIDGYRGTRAVFRFNTFTDCHITVHGTESSGRNRGGRAVEIYKNTHINVKDTEDILANIRSGSALIWGTPRQAFTAGEKSPG